jgi:hypothetical protein
MKKISTVAIEKIQIFKGKQLTIGLDLGDRTSHYPPCSERPSLRRDCGWKDSDRGGPAKTQGSTGRKKKNCLDSHRPSHGRA